MYGRSHQWEPTKREPAGRGPTGNAGTSRISQSWDPKGIVCSKAENAGITAVRKDAVIRCVPPKPAEQIQLYASTEAESGLSLRQASSRNPGDVQTRREPGLNGDHRVGDCQRESEAHGETKLILVTGEKPDVGLGIPDATLQRH